MGRPSMHLSLSGEERRDTSLLGVITANRSTTRETRKISLSLSLSLSLVRRWWSNVGWNREGDLTAISYILYTTET